ncbi:MAG: DUF2199 domain-containing protein [Pseudomonadota bacterium]
MASGLDSFEWVCTCCGLRHRGVPDLAFRSPFVVEEGERGNPRVVIEDKTDDACVLTVDGDRAFFIRGVLPIPIRGSEESFGIGAWSTLSEASFDTYCCGVPRADQGRSGSFYGYLANEVPGFPGSMNLVLDVAPQDGRLRPLLHVQAGEDRSGLSAAQAEGWDRAQLGAFLSNTCGGAA